MTTRRLRYAGAVVLIVSLAGASFALASGGHKNKGSEFHAKLIGYNEVPSLNTTGHATLDLTVTDTTITFKLDYADLTGPPGASHPHRAAGRQRRRVRLLLRGRGQAGVPGKHLRLGQRHDYCRRCRRPDTTGLRRGRNHTGDRRTAGGLHVREHAHREVPGR